MTLRPEALFLGVLRFNSTANELSEIPDFKKSVFDV
jgi:hypothetical protein